MRTVSLKSPFHEEHQALGACFGDVGEWRMPMHYGDAEAEYRAVRERAGIIDEYDRGVLHVKGPQTKRFLHGQLTNEINRRAPGEGCYALQLSSRGRIVSDHRVYVVEEDEAYLVFPWTNREAALADLEKYAFLSRVTLTDLSQAYGVLSIHGPAVPDLLDEVLDRDVIVLERHHVMSCRHHGLPLLLAGSRFTGEVGYHVVGARSSLHALWQSLAGAGAGEPIPPVGRLALETLRIEEGIPRFGIDVDTTSIPLESEHLERTAINFNKGCYLGQELIAKVAHRGHVNRHLVGMVFEGETVPDVGSPVTAGEKSVGPITSAVHSPRVGQPIALGYVRHGSEQAGTQVEVETVGGGRIAGRVVETPFGRPG